jgi:hypothetical protein
MCGGPPKLTIGSRVRLRASDVIGEIVEIDKSDRRRFQYCVCWKTATTTSWSNHRRRELIKASKRDPSHDALQAAMERRLDEKRANRRLVVGRRVRVTVASEARQSEGGKIIASGMLTDSITRYYVVEVGDGDARIVFNGEYDFIGGP